MFQEFRSAMSGQVVFSNHQAQLRFPGFDPRNFTRWTGKGYLVRLRNGLYTFPEYLRQEGLHLYFANRMYRPSYISLHYALNFYGFIPEIISDITSVSTNKTTSFRNPAGHFTYQTIRPEYFAGYESRKINSLSVLFATPEKAVIDLFYLYPMYDRADEIEHLRFDRQMLHNTIIKDRFVQYLDKMNNRSLTSRVGIFMKMFDL